jgi:hypothetical protein
MLWVLAYGTRAEDAAQQGMPPARLLYLPTPATGRQRRWVSIFRWRLQPLRQTLERGYLWRRLWLVPKSRPAPPSNLCILYHTGP